MVQVMVLLIIMLMFGHNFFSTTAIDYESPENSFALFIHLFRRMNYKIHIMKTLKNIFVFVCLFLLSSPTFVSGYDPGTKAPSIDTPTAIGLTQNKVIQGSLNDGLIADFRFNGNSNDLSGSNNNLTVIGGSFSSDRFGRANATFNLVNEKINSTQFLRAVNTETFKLPQYTIKAWFNTSSFYPFVGGNNYNYQAIIALNSQWYNLGPAFHISLLNGDNTKLAGEHWTVLDTFKGVVSQSNTIKTNTWYQVIQRYDGQTLSLFLNGTLLGSIATKVSYDNQIEFNVGATRDGPSPGGYYGGFNGKIDDVTVWNRPLTDEEIALIYDTEKTLTLAQLNSNGTVELTEDNVLIHSEILGNGTGFIYSRGLCYSTSPSPTLEDTCINSGSGSEPFSSGILVSELSKESTYYARAYATNDAGTSFGNEVTFKIQTNTVDLNNGLVAYYPFNGNANDISGNALNGTVNGAVALCADRSGVSNSAYCWPSNGNSANYISIPDIHPLAPQSYSFSAWVYIDGGSINPRIISSGEVGISVNASQNADQKIIRATYDLTPAGATSQPVQTKTWFHLVFTADHVKKEGRFYVNGVLNATESCINCIPSGAKYTNWNIGRKSISAFDTFGGKLDDIRLYNRVLNESEILELSATENPVFTIDLNGIVKCGGAIPGDKGIINGIEYEAVDRSLLIQRRDQGADLTKVCTSLVTDMSELFSGRTFNQPIGNWDVSNVTNMRSMFAGIGSGPSSTMRNPFNQPIGNWDVSSVTNMSGMFVHSNFNQPIGDWNVSAVSTMNGMFGVSDFNYPLNSWNVSSVTDMESMFYSSVFNHPLENWNVSKVTNMGSMFQFSQFNHPIGNWDVSSTTILGAMFYGSKFNHPIGSWNVSNVTNMVGMFYTSQFNQPINQWCVSKIATEPNLFSGGSPLTPQNKPVWGTCPSTIYLHTNGVTIRCDGAIVGEKGTVNGVEYEVVDRALLIQRRDQGADLTKVCTSLVTNMSSMFNGTSFNQPIGNWDVGNVTDMSFMFYVNRSFNQPIGDWDVSNVTNMWAIFDGTRFNQPIGKWNVSKVKNMRGLVLNNSVFNQPLGSWDVSSVEDMIHMFSNSPFNQNIENWNVSNVKTMMGMFESSSFNQHIGGWDVRNVTDMNEMFRGSNFNQPINNWCVTNIKTEPVSFSTFSPLSSSNKPIWGTCPSSTGAPSVTTSAATNVSTTSATTGGNVSNAGSSSVTARGVCYSVTNTNPSLTDSCVSSGSGVGTFSATLTGLSPSTTYYTRAYATNSSGTAYGSSISFTTSSQQVRPILKPLSSSSSVMINQPFRIDVEIGSGIEIQNLYGIAFKLMSKASYVSYVDGSAVRGSFLGNGVLEFYRKTDEQTVEISLTKTASPGVSGKGIVASANFISSQAGNVTFELIDVTALDPAGQPISINSESLSITITTGSQLCVYPGDTNNDSAINGSDLIPIGLYYGQTLSQGNTPGISMQCQLRSPWPADSGTPRRIYADANGDGTVNASDVLAIGLNYGKARPGSKVIEPVKSIANAPSKIDLSLKHQWTNTNQLVLDVYSHSRIDMIGASFSMTLPKVWHNVVRSYTIETQDGIFGDEILRFVKSNTEASSFDVSLVRNDQEARSSNGLLFRLILDLDSNPGIPLVMSMDSMDWVDADGGLQSTSVTGLPYYINSGAIKSAGPELPPQFDLMANYPNPFNPVTQIRYTLPVDSPVNVSVYSLTGTLIKVLVNATQSQGNYQVEFDGSGLASGVYIYRLQAPGFVVSRKMVLMK